MLGEMKSGTAAEVIGMVDIITPTVVGVYRDWPGSSALNLYI